MRRMASGLTATMLAAIVVAGCERPRTELVVRVDSEVAWGPSATVQAITLTVRRGGPSGVLRSQRTTTLGTDDGRLPLPLRVGVLASDDDTETPVWLEALGCSNPNGCTPATAVVAQRAVVRFGRRQTVEVPLLLASACVGVVCRSDQRCEAGQCEAATTAPVGGVDAGTRDAVVDRVTAVDSGTTDLGSDVGGTDAVAFDGPSSCGALELSCGGACRRVLTDPMHCGDCNVMCPTVAGATATCMGGRCGYSCDGAHADCDERASNGCESERAVDHANCGRCGMACTDAQECRDGACGACGTGREWCTGLGCTTLRDNDMNCGGCGTVCPLGYVCRGFSCTANVCDAGVPVDAEGRAIWLQCPGGCVDTEHDPRNCGRCGNVCPPENATCYGGGCRDGMCPQGFRLLPAGSFMMGGDDAGPLHRVTFARASCIMDHEVTAVEYSNCRDRGCVEPTTSAACPSSTLNWPTTGHDWLSVNCLPWSAADAYCRTMVGRLPTEAEWEYAARGTDGRAYPWGNAAPSVTDTPQRLCWNRTDGSCDWREFTAGASAFHAFHMAGNLAEWVADWHGAYPSGAQSDPRGPSSGTERVVRGGSWMQSTPSAFTATARASAPPTTASAAYGFRCIWTP